jgi:hypothetical protein
MPSIWRLVMVTMIERDNTTWPEGLPKELEDFFYEVKFVEVEAPGVYSIIARMHPDRLLTDEFYVVDRSSTIISDAAKKYGGAMSEIPQFLLFPYDKKDGGFPIIAYELARYRVTNGEKLERMGNLHNMAFYGMEQYPHYFGYYPAPTMTPKGYMTRYQTIDNGIFLLETDQGNRLMAVCYAIWESDLSDALTEAGLQTDYDIAHSISETLGYLFFEEPYFCLVIFELVYLREEWVKSGMVDLAALMNAIWRDQPGYAAAHNLSEQSGLHDALGVLLNILGTEVELSSSTDRMIAITPNAGCDYLHLS